MSIFETLFATPVKAVKGFLNSFTANVHSGEKRRRSNEMDEPGERVS